MNGKDTKNANVVINHNYLASMLNVVKICLWKAILVLLGIVIYTMYPSPLFPSYFLIFLFFLICTIENQTKDGMLGFPRRKKMFSTR